MDVVFLTVAFLLGGVTEGEAALVTADEGTDVEIECVHSYANTNVKYFCKSPCRDEDVLIRSNKADPTGKYSIRDAGNTFYVTVHHLTLEDSGTYRCGIDRVGVDTFNDVILTVNENPLQRDARRFSDNLPYIGGGLGALLLVLTVVLLIFFKQRREVTSISSAVTGKDHTTDQKQNATEDAAAPAQGLVYSTVSCKIDDSHSPPPAPEVTYAAVKGPGTEESVYCNV